jgi:hypothetical protein
LLIGFPGHGSSDRSLAGGAHGETPAASDAKVSDRSLFDRSFDPCQESWANGWKEQGSSGVNCYASCGVFSMDCDWSGKCTCTISMGKDKIINPCPKTDGCDNLVETGCCR